MKRITAIWCLCVLFFLNASAQLQKGEIDLVNLPLAKDHYQTEYRFDHPVDSAQWLNETTGLHVSFVSTDNHYFRTELPRIKETADWQATGWKGERLNAMILVWSPDTLEQVRFILHNLVNSKGGILP